MPMSQVQSQGGRLTPYPFGLLVTKCPTQYFFFIFINQRGEYPQAMKIKKKINTSG